MHKKGQFIVRGRTALEEDVKICDSNWHLLFSSGIQEERNSSILLCTAWLSWARCDAMPASAEK